MIRRIQRTHKIFHALEEVCLKWDLGKTDLV